MTEQAPRINAQYLEAFTGKTVMITGKVSQIRGESAVIDANGEVTVLLNRVRTSPSNAYLTIHFHIISLKLRVDP
jgi:replication factor A3